MGEENIEKTSLYGYVFEQTPLSSSQKGIVYDNEGYKYYASLFDVIKNMKRETKLRIFGRSNPFSIENIRHYIKINDIHATILSTEFNSQKLLWRCQCGETFEQTWSVFKNSHHVCKECSKKIIGMKNGRSFSESVSIIHDFHEGYTITSSDYENEQYIYAINPEGYKVSFRRSELNKGEPLVFDVSNPFTIDNIKKWTKIHTNDEYICVSNVYNSGQEPLLFYHKQCKYTSNITWSNFRNHRNKKTGIYTEGQRCAICASLRNESQHAAILKQLFLKYYPDTILEDISCKGAKGVPLPTDIVNHRLKLAIEIQSAYHDRASQKLKDEIKREFWINRGYKFACPDIREYTYLGFAQIFFPELTSLPDWILYDFSFQLDVNKAQKYLDEGYTVAEIAEEMNVTRSSIHNAIAVNRLYYPTENKMKAKNVRRIIQFSLEGEWIQSFDSISQAGRALGGIKKAERIRLHLLGQYPEALGYFWLYEDDYSQAVDVASLYKSRKEIYDIEQEEKKKVLLEEKIIQMKLEFFNLFGKEIDYFPSMKEFELKHNGKLRHQILNVFNNVDTVCREFGLKNHDELLYKRFKIAFPEEKELPSGKRFLKTGNRALWDCLMRRYGAREEIAKALGVSYCGP